MSYGTAIDSALAAHGQWRKRLNDAISSGHSDFTAADTKADNRCDFGKWFYLLPAEMRSSDYSKTVQQLHPEFHAEAASILDLATRGRKGETAKQVAPGTRFTRLSGQLTMALMQ